MHGIKCDLVLEIPGQIRPWAVEIQYGRARRITAVPDGEPIHATGWKPGSRSEQDWRWTLRAYAMPRLGEKRLDRVSAADVMAVLLPIWNAKRVTARKVRQRIGAVMRWAVAQGYRKDNPAGEAIGAALPRQVVRPRHLAALPYGKVAAAVAAVRRSGADPATVLAFEFLVLTACRSGEVRGARWEEMDLEEREWRIPAERMKSRRAHRVPLSRRALMEAWAAFLAGSAVPRR